MRIDVANIRIESGVAPVDTDEDVVNDFFDAFPNDPSEATDSDGDGVGDNADIIRMIRRARLTSVSGLVVPTLVRVVHTPYLRAPSLGRAMPMSTPGFTH